MSTICCCSANIICVTVTDCAGTAISGATVAFSQTGQTTVTATTNGSGLACGTLINTSTWTMTISKTPFTSTTENVTPSSGVTVSLARQLNVCPPSTPFATTHVSITTNGVTFTLNLSSGVWRGTKRLTSVGGYFTDARSGIFCQLQTFLDVDVVLTCSGSTCPTVKQYFGVTGCPTGADCNYIDAGNIGGTPLAGSTITGVTSSPWQMTGTWGGYFPGFGGAGCPAPPFSGTFTITL